MAVEARKGPIRSFFGGLWWLINGTRRLVLNLLFLALLVALGFAFFGGGPRKLQDRTVLVLDLDGPLVEQRSGNPRDLALRQVQGQEVAQTRLRDVQAVLEAAAKDDAISSVLLVLDGVEGGGLPMLREVAAALDRFKAGGKKVVAWSTGYDQRQYYVAAHAHEVYLHPMGTLQLTGFGRQRNYWGDAFERAGVKAHVIRAGKYKNAGETFVTAAPSPETLESEAFVLDAMWGLYTGGVERARKLPEGTLMKTIDALPGSLQAVGGDFAKLALQAKLVDGLKTQDELRKLLIERGAEDEKAGTFRQVSFGEYLARVRPAGANGDAVGVIVAQGEIGDGVAPPGRIGGRSTAELIRKARQDEKVKAIVLRVNSPGGSALGAEMVRRELELARGAGKPVVVSMGDLAASGGYWISLAADEVIADPATITGSIGVIAILPTAEGLVDKLSIRAGGHTTTWLGKAYDVRTGMDPRFEQLVQSAIEHIYGDFTGKAAAARKTTPEKIDAVAQGRIWTGAQAKERGLVDRTGSFADALKSATALAKLPEDARVQYIERDAGRFERLLSMFSAEVVVPVVQSVAQSMGLAPGQGGMPGGMAGLGGPWLGPVQQEAGWLAELLARGNPAAPIVHCLCGP